MLTPRKTLRLQHWAYVRVLELLLTGCHSRAALAEDTGLHILTVGELLREMRRKELIHIGDWVNNTLDRPVIEAWSFGNLPDVPKPKPKSATQRQRDYRARVKTRGITTHLLQG